MNPNSQIKVAIVDDHALIRKCLQELVSLWGYMVIPQATNGKDFLDLLVRGILPDICILDMRMPEMDGYETIKVVKENGLALKSLLIRWILKIHMHNNLKEQMQSFPKAAHIKN